MIDKVLILGVKRAGNLIPDSEISQMIGRCGRSYTESGEATLVVPPEDEDLAWTILNSKPSPILSGLSDVENLSFHFLPEIRKKEKVQEKDFLDWYSRSLSHIQGKTFSFNALMEFLQERECVLKNHSSFILSDLGVLACDYYLSPSSAFQIAARLRDSVFYLDPISISWILAKEKIFKNMEDHEGFQEYLSSCSGRMFWMEKGEDLYGYAIWTVLTNHPIKQIAPERNTIRKDLNRMFGFLKAAGKLYGWSEQNIKDLDKILICVEKRIPMEFADLALAFPEAKRSILMELDSFSIHTPTDLKEKEYRIEQYGSQKLKSFLEECCKSKTRSIEENL